MNRKTILGVVVALGLFAGGVYAQDMIYPFRFAHIDVPLSEAPCALMGPVSMTVYDRNPWIVYTCNTGQVILRRFLNPNDNAIEPMPVIIYPNAQPESPVPAAPATVRCTVPGMVTSIYGGCVPKDHPSAPKR